VGFAGAANASATIDLIWADTGTNQISNVNVSSAITLQVILTAGPNGSAGAVVSVDYSGVLPQFTVLGYASTPGSALPVSFGGEIDTGSRVEGIGSACLCPFVGFGLPAGQSHQLGTVTFHKGFLVSDMFVILNGVFEIRSDANTPTDDVLDLAGSTIADTTTFNSAFLIDVPPPPCNFVIEIKALRGGSPTVTVGSPKNITAKARIQKGTAPPDTTIDVTLQIDAVVGGTVVDTQSSSVQLEVGKGGQGDKLGMLIKRADCKPRDSIDFVATFSGTDVNGSLCEATRRITKTCN
jgi:hypothetical protein